MGRGEGCMIKRFREDFIIDVDDNRITILVKERTFFIFTKWVELTAAETEYGTEEPLEFDTIQEAERFINLICID
jgi:hypothetical protein